jgi:N-acetylglucosaminyldiphosphoundecaprenol N-acetyl-beta-D-mannosaminyltransferase
LDLRQRACCRVLGVPVDALLVSELQARLLSYIREGKHALVLHVNANAINLAWRQPWLRDFFNSADVVFCDGVGVRLAARILGHHLPPRITYADWMWQLAAFSEREELSLFFLGSRPGIADKASACLRRRFPRLRVVGTHHGYFDKTPDCRENEAVVERINTVKPDILLVGFGMPVQERWLLENWDRADARVALSGGAVFDYVSATTRRAPHWMTENGLEWLGRLLIEPRRLWWRYIVGNPLFVARVLRERLMRRGPSRPGSL